MGLRHIMISAVTQLRLIGQLRLAGASGSARPAVRCLGFTSSPEGATQQPTGASRRSASNSTRQPSPPRLPHTRVPYWTAGRAHSKPIMRHAARGLVQYVFCLPAHPVTSVNANARPQRRQAKNALNHVQSAVMWSYRTMLASDAAFRAPELNIIVRRSLEPLLTERGHHAARSVSQGPWKIPRVTFLRRTGSPRRLVEGARPSATPTSVASAPGQEGARRV